MAFRTLKLSGYFLLRAAGIFALWRKFTTSRVRILCYHGGCIDDENQYNSLLFCPPHVLASRISWLSAKGFTIMPLDDAVNLAATSAARIRLPTVITFDDGWYSTGSALLPVLKRFGIPSTLYLSTRHFLDAVPIPAVTVRYLMWKSSFPRVTVIGFGEHVDGDYDLLNPAQHNQLAEQMSAWLSDRCADKALIYDALYRFASSLGIDPGEMKLNSRRFHYLSEQELREASVSGCSIQLHGHIHRYPRDDPAQLERDVRQCKQVIVDLGLPVPRHYCYPSGNFDTAAPEVLNRLGVSTATTCYPGLVHGIDGNASYFLPRFLDGGRVSALEFEAEMSGFADFVRACARFAKVAPSISQRRIAPRPS